MADLSVYSRADVSGLAAWLGVTTAELASAWWTDANVASNMNAWKTDPADPHITADPTQDPAASAPWLDPFWQSGIGEAAGELVEGAADMLDRAKEALEVTSPKVLVAVGIGIGVLFLLSRR